MIKEKKQLIKAHKLDNFRKGAFRDFYQYKATVSDNASKEAKERAAQFKVKADQLQMEIAMNRELVNFLEERDEQRSRLWDLWPWRKVSGGDLKEFQETDGQDDNSDEQSDTEGEESDK